ncbi:hypothetical protein [Paenibacillus thiaminolyticus]|uniref:Uncharacterized protein n=1 Tax=Paenibacillus thiaminolyticus TaxID=49283 RepID=A0A3A3G8C0_PANTH|nr:hypothetical protein [Paenibacillus thiaminolyticus]RJG15632.1 hypothetical protein DQX05_29565 [Paenibacillus thiaminolyticus]
MKALTNETLPAAKAAVWVQEWQVTIAKPKLQGQIAATDLAYARDLLTYQNERFLNRDFWDALAGVARRSLHATSTSVASTGCPWTLLNLRRWASAPPGLACRSPVRTLSRVTCRCQKKIKY